jgi:hypothetical protein
VFDHTHRDRGFVQPDDGLATRGTFHPGRGEEGRDQRPGHQRPPELLEHQRGFGDPEPESSVRLRQRQREHTGLPQFLPATAVEGAGRLDLPHRVERKPAVEKRADALLERLLVAGELEVHLARFLRRIFFGPIFFGEAEDALADDVAVHLRRPRGDGHRQRVEARVHVSTGRQVGEIVK